METFVHKNRGWLYETVPRMEMAKCHLEGILWPRVLPKIRKPWPGISQKRERKWKKSKILKTRHHLTSSPRSAHPHRGEIPFHATRAARVKKTDRPTCRWGDRAVGSLHPRLVGVEGGLRPFEGNPAYRLTCRRSTRCWLQRFRSWAPNPGCS